MRHRRRDSSRPIHEKKLSTMRICPRCGSQFTGKKDKIYCAEYCRKKLQKQRNRRRRAPGGLEVYKEWFAAQAELARRRRGPPRVRSSGPRSLAERLEVGSFLESNFGCRLWCGGVNGGGYGQISVDGRKMLVHRVAYQLAFGPIPDGLDVLHHCDTPCCISPDHLYAGTHQDNMDAMVRRGRVRGRRDDLTIRF
jgi:hypothetical protein